MANGRQHGVIYLNNVTSALALGCWPDVECRLHRNVYLFEFLF